MPKLLDDYPVPPRSLREIEAIMNRLRASAGLLEADTIDPFEFMSALDIKFEVRTMTKMHGAISFALAQDNTICATREVAKGLRLREPKFLHTWGHEVAHLELHPGSGPKARLAGQGNRSINFIPDEVSAECQAWLGSRALFLPRSELSIGLSAEELAAKVGLPLRAVEMRLQEVQEFESRFSAKNKPSLPKALLIPALVADDICDSARLSAWQRATPIDGEDPKHFRLARGFKIRWADYKRLATESDYAWVIWGGEARCCRDVFAR